MWHCTDGLLCPGTMCSRVDKTIFIISTLYQSLGESNTTCPKHFCIIFHPKMTNYVLLFEVLQCKTILHWFIIALTNLLTVTKIIIILIRYLYCISTLTIMYKYNNNYKTIKIKLLMHMKIRIWRISFLRGFVMKYDFKMLIWNFLLVRLKYEYRMF